MKTIKKVISEAFVKIHVPYLRWENMDFFDGRIAKSAKLLKRANTIHDNLCEIAYFKWHEGEKFEVEYDPRNIESDYKTEYVVAEADSTVLQPNVYHEKLYDAIEQLIGEEAPIRTVYRCRAKNKSIHYFYNFMDVVEWFWENYETFSCDELNEEETLYLDKIRYHIFSLILSGDK